MFAVMECLLECNAPERLAVLQENMAGMADVCSSGGVVSGFPACMSEGFVNFGIGLVVCHEGEFCFTMSGNEHTACGGQTVFIPDGAFFCATRQSANLRLSIIVYKTEPIRYVLGTMVHSVRLYSIMSPERHCVWSTGNEDSLARYISLIGAEQPRPDDFFAVNERKLLLLSLTYRLCKMFSEKYFGGGSPDTRRTETFLKLIRLIDRYYMSERGVAFYAGKLFLTPKYLSELSKSVCGYTVQELVFKAITRRAMSLLDSTNKTVAEISDEFNFPNPSSFGTFFKKQTGMSPQKYRDRI